MEELEKIKLAKTYIDKLANGIDPITGAEMPQDTILNNVRLSRCFFYVSDILQQVIVNGGIFKSAAKSFKKDFYITDEQKKSFGITTPICYMKELIEKINVITEENYCRKFQHRWLTEWLVIKGFMEEYTDDINKKRKKVTIIGESIGLKTEIRNSLYGNYPVTLIDVNAQKFIIDNIGTIASEIGLEKEKQTAEYQGNSWNTQHEEILVDLFNKQVPVYEIAVTLKRTEAGIRARLKKLGMIEHRSDAK